MKIFIDTSAFIALNDRSDRLHSAANGFIHELSRSDRLYTSNYVIDESITRLRYMAAAQDAISFAENIFKSRLITTLYVDADVDAAALAALKRYKDKKLSFTDCASIAIVKERGFDAIFSFDDDFKKVGLRVVP